MEFKRAASAVCALALVFGMAAAPAADGVFRKASPVVVVSADDEYTYGDYKYTVDDGNVTITEYTGSGEDIKIPSKIDGKSVTGIGEWAFIGCRFLTSITFPESIRDISEFTFNGCSSLKAFKFDGNNSYYCSVDGVLFTKDKTMLHTYPAGKEATSYTIPDGVTSISNGAFWGCINLTNITISNDVTSIGEGAFGYCISLTSITIPDGITRIADRTFYNCKSLTNVKLPDSVLSIGSCAFEKCIHLTSITLPANLIGFGPSTFMDCTSLKRVTIPVSVINIIDASFDGCKNLTDVYYGGTKEQWKAINIYDENEELYNATIHCTDGVINPAKKSLSKAKVKAANKVYTGKALTPAVTVTLDGKTLKKNTDYTVSYKNNKNCGKATVTVTGKGDYTRTKSGSFIIKPAKVAAKKLTSPKKNTIKLTWTKAKGGVTGYQVMTATNKKFNKGKKTYNVKAAAASKTIKSLKSKKTYFAKVRAFKKVDGKNYFGAWSKIKKVKCK